MSRLLEHEDRSFAWILEVVGKNFYHLGRQEFYELRKFDNDPALRSAIVRKFTKADLHSLEGLSWFSGFQDLIFAMSIYRLEGSFTKCGDEIDLTSSINLIVITISYFLIFLFNRYVFEQYCVSFVRYAKNEAYPLAQSDLFHRIIFTLYSIGNFLMTMNTSFVQITNEKIKNSYVGSCKFVPSYLTGFASGMLIARGSIILLYLAIIFLAQDVGLYRRYRATFLIKIMLSIASLMLISGCFNAEKGNDEYNKKSIFLFACVAALECLHDPIIHFLSSFNALTKKYRVYSIPVALLEQQENTIVFSENQVGLLEDKKRDLLFYNGQKLQERLSEVFKAVLGESLFGLLVESYDPKNAGAILVSFLVLLLLISAGLQFFETVAGKSVTVEHALTGPFTLRHAFVTMQIAASFCFWVATCGMIGLYAHVLFILPGKSSHSKKSVAPTSFPTYRPSGDIFNDDKAANDYYYNFYYADISTEYFYVQSVGLSEWCIAIGLCLTGLCCIVLRMMHICQQRATIIKYTMENVVNLSDAQPSDSILRTLTGVRNPSHDTFPAYFTSMEVIYIFASTLHLCIFFFFGRIRNAHTATILAFTCHSLVNIIVCAVYLTGKFMADEKQESVRLSHLLSASLPTSNFATPNSRSKNKSLLSTDELRLAVADDDRYDHKGYPTE